MVHHLFEQISLVVDGGKTSALEDRVLYWVVTIGHGIVPSLIVTCICPGHDGFSSSDNAGGRSNERNNDDSGTTDSWLQGGTIRFGKPKRAHWPARRDSSRIGSVPSRDDRQDQWSCPERRRCGRWSCPEQRRCGSHYHHPGFVVVGIKHFYWLRDKTRAAARGEKGQPKNGDSIRSSRFVPFSVPPAGCSQSPYCCAIILWLVPPGRSLSIMDDPPPSAKWQETTTTAAEAKGDGKEPSSIRAEERRRAAATDDDRTVMDLLRLLPASIVANYILPFASKVIKNRDELIAAVDEYLDEFYSNDNGEAKNDDEDIGNNQNRYPIGDWDVYGVDDFTSVFAGWRNIKAVNFNEDLSRWNVAHGTMFARMFAGCTSFNSDLSRWDTANATDLSYMFIGCVSFNADLLRWNVANAANLSHMFHGCTSFNSDLSIWNMANATYLNNMFEGCTSFNSDLSRWNTANATELSIMFENCISFSSDLSDWNVANATRFDNMFYGCTSFNSDLSRWNVSNATVLSGVFTGCTRFNSDLSRWNVANAYNFCAMFSGCTSFNSDLSRWNVAKAGDLSGMFYGCTIFNSDLSRWNVANANDFNRMFAGCTSFNSDVSQWDVANAIRFPVWYVANSMQNMAGMFCDCDSFDRTFVATWPLPDEQSVEVLFFL
jgi:surface protein